MSTVVVALAMSPYQCCDGAAAPSAYFCPKRSMSTGREMRSSLIMVPALATPLWWALGPACLLAQRPTQACERKDGIKPTAASRQHQYVPALSFPPSSFVSSRVFPLSAGRGITGPEPLPRDLSCHIQGINTSDLHSRSMSYFWITSVPLVVCKKAL